MSIKDQLIEPIRSEIKPGMVIGVGTGSTVELVIRSLGAEVFSKVTCLTTSLKTDLILREFNISSVRNEVIDTIDFAFDGTDIITPFRAAIKGKGAAFLNEKIVASKAKRFALVADESRLVESLDNQSIPVEIVREALAYGIKELTAVGTTEVKIRESAGGLYGPVITEHGNTIVDVRFAKVTDQLESQIKSIVGVVESGLFYNRTTVAYVATEGGLKVY